MDNDGIKELFRHHREFQNKYAYFLLAVAASGIAFAIQKSEGAYMAWPLAPLGLAVLNFGASFFLGMRQIEFVGALLAANYSYLQLLSGVHPDQPPNDETLQAATNGVKRAMNRNMNRAETAATWQIRSLLAGFLFFVIWHILDIHIRTLYQ